MNPYKEKIKHMNKLAEMWELVQISDCPYEISGHDNNIIVKIYDLSELHGAREFCKSVFGVDRMEFKHVFHAVGYGIATWKCNEPIEIWFEKPIDEFPTSLNGKRVYKFVRAPEKPDYRFVCETEE